MLLYNVLVSFCCCCGLGVKRSIFRPKIRNGFVLSKDAVSLWKRKKKATYFEDWSKLTPVSLQKQSYSRCTEVCPVFFLYFQTNRCPETDRKSRSTPCWSTGAIRYTENGCGKNSLFREQSVKLIVTIKFARKVQWAQQQTNNLPSVSWYGQITPSK